MKYIAIILALVAVQANAIDSLLKKAAKEEEKRVKAAKKADTAARLTLSSGEEFRCVWLARVGNEFRYLRADGKLIATPMKDVTKVEGKVLDAVPDAEVTVHHMYCNGKACEATVKTIHVPAWPSH